MAVKISAKKFKGVRRETLSTELASMSIPAFLSP
jgi:hypothetical protein